MGEIRVKEALQFYILAKAKVLLWSLIQSNKGREVLVAVCLLKLHAETVQYGDGEDFINFNGREYQVIVSGTGAE